MTAFQLVRGMRDILPDDAARWRETEELVINVLRRYGYREIRLPLLEATALFARGVGEATDLVEKEMYTFPDRKGKSLSLRPEGTAGCVRAAIEHGLLRGSAQRFWYHGPMFRYERPQQGRTREHAQIGAEAFGVASPDIDAELLILLARAFRELEVADAVTLELNTLGASGCRTAYRQALLDYLTPHADALDDASRQRLTTNPLRVLDSKAPATRAIVADAPNILDHLNADAQTHFDGVRRRLDQAGVPYEVNPRLVRGLDYYNHTVFEWTTTALGSQNAVCAGGRYDGLVERLGGRATPGAGFAIGLDRLVLLRTQRTEDRRTKVRRTGVRCCAADVYVACVTEAQAAHAGSVAEAIRDATRLRVLRHAGVASLKSQLRAADRSGARWAVIIGEEEARQGGASLRPLRHDSGASEQMLLGLEALLCELQAGAKAPPTGGEAPANGARLGE